MGIPDYLICLLRTLYGGQEASVRTRHGTMDWFQIGKEYIKAIYCYPAYLTYMQSTSCKMLGWMTHKLEPRLLGEISTTSYMTNLGSIIKSRDITLLTKVYIVKSMVFPVVMYGCEGWAIKRAERRRIDALNCGVGEDS